MANNCDDAFQADQQLQEEIRALQQQVDGYKARLAALGALPDAADSGRAFLFRDGTGRLRKLTDDQVQAMHLVAAAKMESSEVAAIVDRGIGEEAVPVGAEGRFLNYRQLLARLGEADAGEHATVMEALFKTWEEFQPADFAYIKRRFTQEQVDSIAKLVRSQFNDDPVAAGSAVLDAIQKNAAGFQGLAERKVRIRLHADMAVTNYLEALGDAADAMDAVPGMPLPPELKQQLFSTFKLGLMAERQDKFANRMLGQALKSQQLDLGAAQSLVMDASELRNALEIKAADVTGDSHFAKVMEAIDQRDPEAIRELIKVTELDRKDPMLSLENGWKDPNVRYAIALAKDSQLTSIKPNLVSNFGGNGLMNLYGFYRTAVENMGVVAHHGANGSEAFWQGLQMAWKSERLAMDLTRAAAKDLMGDAFHRGKVLYGGNADLPDWGKTANQMVLEKVQATFNQPITPIGANGERLAQPQIVARAIGKLQAGVRLTLFEKSGGQHYWLLTPGFRSLAAVDNMAGYHAYVFGARNDLELRARIQDVSPEELLRDKANVDRLPFVDKDGNVQQPPEPLEPKDFFDLNNPKERQEWIDRETEAIFRSQAPTDKEVKQYRKANGLKSDVTDDEIRQVLAAENAAATYQGPDYTGRSANLGRKYSDFTRMQHEQEGALGHIDMAVQQLRRHWAVDAVVPYWRAPFNAFLFDTTLGFPPMTRTLELWGKARRIEGGWKALPAHEVARVQAGWATSGVMLSLFAGLNAAGLIVGNGPLDPKERQQWLASLQGKAPNSIGGVPLGGLPILNTLFLWKDLGDAWSAGLLSSYDAQDLFEGVAQVLTSQIVRQTGFAQIKGILDVLMDPDRNVRRFASQMATGLAQPFVGLERSLAMVTGSGQRNFYTPGRTGSQEWRLAPDDPFEVIRKNLNNAAYSLAPGSWSTVAWAANMTAGAVGAPAPVGDRRITNDFLGTPIRFPYGTPLEALDAMPGAPGLDPPGDQRLYAELRAQGMLVAPYPLRAKQLDGVAMTPALQKEYNDTFGAVKSSLPLSARMDMDGKKVTLSLPMRWDATARDDQRNAILFQVGETQQFELAPFLDKHVQGKTVQQALRSLINDPIYQAMQDSPATSSDPRVRDMPPAERRKQAANAMIQGIYDYYQLLTRDRLWQSPTPAAAEWREKRKRVSEGIQQDSMGKLLKAGQIISGQAE